MRRICQLVIISFDLATVIYYSGVIYMKYGEIRCQSLQGFQGLIIIIVLMIIIITTIIIIFIIINNKNNNIYYY